MDTELEQLLGNLSLDDLDNVINRMERVQVTNNKDDDVMGLLGAMSTLNVVPNNKKLSKAIEGVKKHRKRMFVKKYKSLKGKKSKAVTSSQLDDMFATMDALKQDEMEDEESIDLDDIMAELNDVEMDGGAKKKKRKSKKQKGGFGQRGPYEVHSKWPRFKINQNNAVRDLKSTNKRSLRSLKKLAGGAKKKKIVKKKIVKKTNKSLKKKQVKKNKRNSKK